jgi:hypothetical protein
MGVQQLLNVEEQVIGGREATATVPLVMEQSGERTSDPADVPGFGNIAGASLSGHRVRQNKAVLVGVPS